MQYVGEKFIKVINFLKDTYVSVDLRGVFAFAKQENQWELRTYSDWCFNKILEITEKIYGYLIEKV